MTPLKAPKRCRIQLILGCQIGLRWWATMVVKIRVGVRVRNGVVGCIGG